MSDEPGGMSVTEWILTADIPGLGTPEDKEIRIDSAWGGEYFILRAPDNAIATMSVYRPGGDECASLSLSGPSLGHLAVFLFRTIRAAGRS